MKGFLSLFENPPAPEEREPALRLALDRLALASHFAEAPSDERSYPDPPRADDALLRSRLESLFPEFGYYSEALAVLDTLGGSAVGLGDAVEDLVEIAEDLREVVFRWENTSEADAFWHFRFGFKSHWGKHLRSLQLYLHVRAS